MKTKKIITISVLFMMNNIMSADIMLDTTEHCESQNKYEIRKYSKSDISQLISIIKTVRAEFGFDSKHPDAQLLEEELNHTFDIYDGNMNNYFVIEYGSKIVGGGGYATLSDIHQDICEIKAMYLLPETRGLGFGSILLNKVLEEAKSDGFKKCYLETNDFMHGANALYTKFKFKILDKPLLAEHKWTNRYYIKELE